jgi:hypothetical protein
MHVHETGQEHAAAEAVFGGRRPDPGNAPVVAHFDRTRTVDGEVPVAGDDRVGR